jgi:hypothetical protein
MMKKIRKDIDNVHRIVAAQTRHSLQGAGEERLETNKAYFERHSGQYGLFST